VRFSSLSTHSPGTVAASLITVVLILVGCAHGAWNWHSFWRPAETGSSATMGQSSNEHRGALDHMKSALSAKSQTIKSVFNARVNAKQASSHSGEQRSLASRSMSRQSSAARPRSFAAMKSALTRHLWFQDSADTKPPETESIADPFLDNSPASTVDTVSTPETRTGTEDVSSKIAKTQESDQLGPAPLLDVSANASESDTATVHTDPSRVRREWMEDLEAVEEKESHAAPAANKFVSGFETQLDTLRVSLEKPNSHVQTDEPEADTATYVELPSVAETASRSDDRGTDEFTEFAATHFPAVSSTRPQVKVHPLRPATRVPVPVQQDRGTLQTLDRPSSDLPRFSREPDILNRDMVVDSTSLLARSKVPSSNADSLANTRGSRFRRLSRSTGRQSDSVPVSSNPTLQAHGGFDPSSTVSVDTQKQGTIIRVSANQGISLTLDSHTGDWRDESIDASDTSAESSLGPALADVGGQVSKPSARHLPVDFMSSVDRMADGMTASVLAPAPSSQSSTSDTTQSGGSTTASPDGSRSLGVVNWENEPEVASQRGHWWFGYASLFSLVVLGGVWYVTSRLRSILRHRP